MSFPELFAIAVALAMDAFAVSVCAGCALKRVTAVHFLRLSLTFGFFQFLMPVIGWALGLTVRGFIESWDHWIAFALLAWIGGNMIRGGGDDSEDGESCSVDPTKGRKLLILAVATSIDALAVGLSFSLLHLPIIFPAMIIGIVCTLISAGGMAAGARLGRIGCVRCWAGVAGGVALLGIGLSILYEHGVFDAAGS